MNRERLRELIIGRFSLRRVLVSGMIIYLIVLAYVYLTAEGRIFLPPEASYGDDETILKLRSGQRQRISAVFLENASSDFTVLYAHGNAEDLGQIRPLLDDFVRHGFSVMTFDYRGYGTRTGQPSELGAYQDMQAAYRHLRRDRHIPACRIIACGRSLGSAMATDLACRERLAGLVLVSPFTSAFCVVTGYPLFPLDKFRNTGKIKQVQCPVVVVHGIDDEVVPLAHGQRLFAQAPSPKACLWVEAAGHNDLLTVASERFWGTFTELTRMIEGH